MAASGGGMLSHSISSCLTTYPAEFEFQNMPEFLSRLSSTRELLPGTRIDPNDHWFCNSKTVMASIPTQRQTRITV
jgi:hypothetical protein